MGLVAVTAPARAQAPLSAPAEARPAAAFEEALFAGVSVGHDNDGWPHPGNSFRDDNYSAGMEVRIAGRVIKRAGLSRPLEGLDWLTRVNRLHARGARRFHAVQFLGLAYTPDIIDSAEPQRDDRPFASLMGLSVRRTSVDAVTLDRAWSSELFIGALGLDAARGVQTVLHRTRRWMTGNPTPPDPLGWSNQISEGGEPTALYRVGYQRHLAGARSARTRKHWQVTGGLEGSVGYQTNAAGSVSARVGAFTSDFWEFSSGTQSFGVGQQHPGAAGAPRWDLFAFGVVRPRLVAYNALLQGQFRDSVHTVPIRHLVGEWEGGVAVSLPMGAYRLQTLVQFAQGRSTEFVVRKARWYQRTRARPLIGRRPGRYA
jgi:Uncharacterized protein conserved in bacteria (DUF2219)